MKYRPVLIKGQIPMFKISKGFTLIELIVTLFVLAVVIGMALPSFNKMIISSRSASLGTEMEVALNYARIEAVKRAGRVSICSSTDGATCAAATDWDKGWLVFVDNAALDSSAVSVGSVLRFWNDIPPNAKIAVKKGAVAVNFIRFNSLGKLAANEAINTHTYVTGCKSNEASDIKVGVAGLISKAKANCP
jgi:type IV fimbrial biogenesis protein FimT